MNIRGLVLLEHCAIRISLQVAWVWILIIEQLVVVSVAKIQVLHLASERVIWSGLDVAHGTLIYTWQEALV